MATLAIHPRAEAVTPSLLALREALAEARAKPLARFDLGDLTVAVQVAAGAVWAIVRREGRGGVALRATQLNGAFECASVTPEPGEAVRLEVEDVLGRHSIVFRTGGEAQDNLRVTSRFTPAMATTLPYVPRDLHPLDAHDDPLAARGVLEAKQRQLNSGCA